MSSLGRSRRSPTTWRGSAVRCARRSCSSKSRRGPGYRTRRTSSPRCGRSWLTSTTWTTRARRSTRAWTANDPTRHELADPLTRSRDPQSGVARAALQTLRGRAERLIIVPQNLYEFWAVATRPPGRPPAGSNGLGMTTAQAGQWLRSFQRWFTLLQDRPRICESS
jgi:hypothetical protein